MWHRVLLLGIFVLAGPVEEAVEEVARGPRLVVPAYFYPAGKGLAEWDRLLKSGEELEIVAIINPASGPGRRVDPNYAALLKRAARTKLVPIGYVTTSYAKRPVAEVKAEVDRWIRFYPSVRGIFFDEMASGSEQMGYQAELYEYVKKERGLVVCNPGMACAEEYFSRPAADVICLFEGVDQGEDFRLPQWSERYAARVCALPYGVKDSQAMRAWLGKLKQQKVGYFYLTDGTGERALEPLAELLGRGGWVDQGAWWSKIGTMSRRFGSMRSIVRGCEAMTDFRYLSVHVPRALFRFKQTWSMFASSRIK